MRRGAVKLGRYYRYRLDAIEAFGTARPPTRATERGHGVDTGGRDPARAPELMQSARSLSRIATGCNATQHARIERHGTPRCGGTYTPRAHGSASRAHERANSRRRRLSRGQRPILAVAGASETATAVPAPPPNPCRSVLEASTENPAGRRSARCRRSSCPPRTGEPIKAARGGCQKRGTDALLVPDPPSSPEADRQTPRRRFRLRAACPETVWVSVAAWATTFT